MGTQPAQWRIAAVSYPCPSCGAAPGRPCIAWTGRERSTEVHTARSSLASSHHWKPAELICAECGDDLAAEGSHYCTDCLERGADDDDEG